MLTLPSFSIRTYSLWIAIGISVVLHIVLLLNFHPEQQITSVKNAVSQLEISLNKSSMSQQQKEKPQIPSKQKPTKQKPTQPVAATSSAPTNVQTPKKNKVVQSKIVKPKLAPSLRSSQLQTKEESISNTTPLSATEKHSQTHVDNTVKRQQEKQKIKADYLTELAMWLNQHKRYPAVARRRGQEGEISVRFSINTEGKLLSHEIVSPAKHASLNAAVVKMLQEASPMPAIPVELRNGKTKFEYTIPVLFKLAGKS